MTDRHHHAKKSSGPSLKPYRGAGSWVDIYDPAAQKRPEAVVADMAAHGVRTLYLETANFKQKRDLDIVYPVQAGRFIDAAHAQGMRVVAWYLAGLTDVDLDLRRTLAAIRYSSPTGGHFDSFALDIESTLVPSIPARNAALFTLSRRIRKAVGRDYALGAIVPDERSSTISPGLWPGFPYRGVAGLYDVFLPMSYSSNRGQGATFVYRYTRSNLRLIRQASGRGSRTKIHMIGGLANTLDAGEAKAVVTAARDGKAIGVSFYDYVLTGPVQWHALRSVK
jgi:hypothetical protein